MDRATPTRPSLSAIGGRPFLITGAIGRLPASTLQLGLLMFVTASGLGFGLGGLTVAAVGLGTAFGAPVIGRLVDRFGAWPVIGAAIVLQTVGLLSMLVVVQHPSQPVLVLACAALVGAANPQIGPVARGRWSMLSRERNDPALVRYALGYEGACDEAGFVLGPALAGVLVGVLGPVPALWTLLLLTWIGEGVFLAYLWLHRDEWQRVATLGHDETGARLRPSSLAWPLIACLAVGMVFGSTQTALTAVHAAARTPELTGLVYGCVGIGSAVVSFLVVRLVGVPLSVRIAVGGAVVTVATFVLSLAHGPVSSAVVAVFVGAAVGAIIVSAFAGIEQVSPASRINSAMTLGATCLTLGVSVGAASAGMLVSTPSAGYRPAIVAGVLALLAGALMLAGEQRRTG